MAKKRNTRQKEIILEEINKINSFFSVDDLQKQLPNIGVATIYRMLNKLKEDGEIYSYICNRKNIYSTSKRSHCHFIDEETGEITHFSIDNIDAIKNKIPGDISSIQIEVRGRKTKN